MQLKFESHPHAWRHPKWNRIQLRYFREGCKTRREKNLEDFLYTNGISRVHLIRDNSILNDFMQEQGIQKVPAAEAEAVIVTSQPFSRLDTATMLHKLRALLEQCPRIYLCINKWYLNGNQARFESDLPDNYDVAMLTWLKNGLPDTTVTNLTETFPEDGSWFTWVIPSCEFLLCRK